MSEKEKSINWKTIVKFALENNNDELTWIAIKNYKIPLYENQDVEFNKKICQLFVKSNIYKRKLDSVNDDDVKRLFNSLCIGGNYIILESILNSDDSDKYKKRIGCMKDIFYRLLNLYENDEKYRGNSHEKCIKLLFEYGIITCPRLDHYMYLCENNYTKTLKFLLEDKLFDLSQDEVKELLWKSLEFGIEHADFTCATMLLEKYKDFTYTLSNINPLEITLKKIKKMCDHE